MQTKYEAKPNHPGATIGSPQLKELVKKLPKRVMTDADWKQWTEFGYVVIPNLISQDLINQVVEAVWAFEGKDPNNLSTWDAPERSVHKMTELNNTGMIEIYHHPAMWQIRQQQKMYDLFVDIWDREDLWVSIDRANLNTPNRGVRNLADEKGFIHFDVDSSARPLPVSVQGVLALTKQNSETGGFQCVPKLFQELESWSDRQPKEANPFQPDISGYDIESVPLNPGDMLVFNALLPHGVRPNFSENKVRMAQYVSMAPAMPENLELTQERVALWQNQEAPQGDAFPGDPRGFERANWSVAELSELGRRLLGRDPW